MNGGRRGVSILSHRPVTSSELKQDRLFFRESVSTFLLLVVATLSFVLLYGQATQLHCQVHVFTFFLPSGIQSGEETDVGRKRLNQALESLFTLTLFVFRTKQGA